ncbi:MAG: GNAT family N-acetyltransferase [Gaiella sp.]|nr:GNAT family N-acetyltransferase [Gaiella sp.]
MDGDVENGDVEICELALDDRSGHEAYAALWNAVLPLYPITADELERQRLRRPGDVRLLGKIDWAVAGCAAAIRSDLPGRTYMGNVVLPEYRRRGLGRAFLERIAAVARRHGHDVLAAGVEEGDEGGEAFAARFGLIEVLRELEISRRLAPDEPEPVAPAGIAIVEVSTRPDLLRDAYALACEALPQMPLHAPLEVPSYDRWVEEDATGADVLSGGTLLALDGDRVVGFVSLLRRAADPRLAEHGLTSVAESHRNRGIATSLKRAQIAWASRNGYRELMTSTQDANAPMRAVNARLGYEPRPAWIRFEAPLEEIEARLAGDARRRRP